LSGEELERQLSPTILALAEDLLPILPELERRIIAVSEMEVTRTNTPTFPIGMLALQEITFSHNEKTNKVPQVTEVIVGEFWFKSNKLKTSVHTETPFWSYYNYDPLLAKLVTFIMGWISPKGYKLKIVRMDLESDELAVQVSFTFSHTYDFCPLYEDEEDSVRILPHVRVEIECDQHTKGV
jgi:hypothetical protein